MSTPIPTEIAESIATAAAQSISRTSYIAGLGDGAKLIEAAIQSHPERHAIDDAFRLGLSYAHALITGVAKELQ